jgi:hypothetical protein
MDSALNDAANSAMNNANTRAGGCLCGAVRYEVAGAASDLSCCHCRSCRRGAGAPMVAWGTFALAGFRVTRGQLAQYESSPGATRGFCAACGTSLTYRHERHADEIDVTLATVDEKSDENADDGAGSGADNAAALEPDAHIWVSERLAWVRIADGKPQFARTRAGTP